MAKALVKFLEEEVTTMKVKTRVKAGGGGFADPDG
jgi:hypothetical protein